MMDAVAVKFKCERCGREEIVKVIETVDFAYNQYILNVDCDEGMFCDCDEDDEECEEDEI